MPVNEAGTVVFKARLQVHLCEWDVKTEAILRRLHTKLVSQIYLPHMIVVQHILGCSGGDDLPLANNVGFFADIKRVTYVVVGD